MKVLPLKHLTIKLTAMPRQTFLSKDFFINASEEVAKQHILELPKSVSNIKLVEENQRLQSLKFLYDGIDEHPDNIVDVSLLPLNVHQTKVTLHCSYRDGCSFNNDFNVKNTLVNFESAINAAVVGDMSIYQPKHTKTAGSTNRILVGVALVASLGCIFYILFA